jgi:gentisate 1,2-dioxygenase
LAIRATFVVNPATGNTYATTRNIVGAYQMIQPGETARSTPAALRLVLDAPTMSTPSWTVSASK